MFIFVTLPQLVLSLRGLDRNSKKLAGVACVLFGGLTAASGLGALSLKLIDGGGLTLF